MTFATRIKDMYRSAGAERLLAIPIIGSFIGIWHALPLTNIINDEMYFVGGVLRAMQAKSLIPLPGDVPYGLLTFWLNYLLFIAVLCVLFAVVGFKGAALKSFLVAQAGWLYLVPRSLNALAAGGVLFIVRDILQRAGVEKRTRTFLLFVLFTDLIVSAVLHTGKMWVVSIGLVLLSVCFLYRTVRSADPDMLRRDIFLSILFAFLAFANFPLCGFALIAIPLLFAFHRKDRRLVWAIGRSALIGAAVFVLLFLANAGNIISQVTDIFTVYHPIGAAAAVPHAGISVWQSFVLHATQALVLFPLLILVIGVGAFRGVKDRLLFVIACSYTAVYFVLICILVTWSADLHANLRYLFPLGPFFALIAASLSLPVGRWMGVMCSISFIPYALFLFRLSVPTTYNQAVSWAVSEPSLQGAVVVNQVGPRLDLPKDARSYRLTQEKFCGSKCHEALSSTDGPTAPFLVIDAESGTTLPAFEGAVYRFTTSTEPLPGESLAWTASNGGDVRSAYEIDYAVGNYFDPTFYLIRRFGEMISVFRRDAHATGPGSR